MEYTRDVLEDRFGVSGGSAIVSDGAFYWRLDGADYVQTYGIGLPPDFVAHAQTRGWQPPTFDEATFLKIYAELESSQTK